MRDAAVSDAATSDAAARRRPVVGVLAVQGDVAEHITALAAAGAEPREVKTEAELAAVDALIIPGGESTTVIRLLERFGLDRRLIDRAHEGMPVWGTCMGMIVIARGVAGLDQRTLGLLDVVVRRNAFGRQIESAEIELDVPELGAPAFPGVFIRAPWIEEAGRDVRVLADLDGHGVLVRQGHILGSSFHPELTADRRLHAYFVRMAAEAAAHRARSA